MIGVTEYPLQLDKAAFFRDLGYEPHEGQRAIHQSRAPRRIVACGVRWGKTVCAAMEGLAAAMEPRERSVGWVCAPTYDLAEGVVKALEAAQAALAPAVVEMGLRVPQRRKRKGRAA